MVNDQAAALIFGTILVASSACISIPQVVRTLRSKNLAGLSLTTAVAFAAGWSMWLVYSISIASWPQVVSQSIGLLLQVVLVLAMLRASEASMWKDFSKGAALAVMGVVGCSVSFMVGGWVAFAVSVAVFDAVFILPQIKAVVCSKNLSGLSPVSYVMRLVFASGWVTYALLIGHIEAAGSSLLWLVFSSYVLFRLLRQPKTLLSAVPAVV